MRCSDAQRPVAWSFDILFDLCFNKRSSKQWWGWWFETPSRPSCRHCNDFCYHLMWQVMACRSSAHTKAQKTDSFHVANFVVTGFLWWTHLEPIQLYVYFGLRFWDLDTRVSNIGSIRGNSYLIHESSRKIWDITHLESIAVSRIVVAHVSFPDEGLLTLNLFLPSAAWTILWLVYIMACRLLGA